MVIVLINIIACTIFEKISAFEKRQTINDETIGQFFRITIMQFTNIAVVILLVNLDLLDGDFLGFIPILNGKYPGFTSDWYAVVGKMICMTLLINIFSPHASKLSLPVLKLCKRCCDRGCCRCSLHNPNGKDHDVNTKKLLLSDVNALYTGDQISSHYVYAQNFTYLWCVLAYSAGLPILYPLAAVFFMILYWVYKFLLLKYYSKTTKFNEELPMISVAYIKVGIVIHIVFTVFMISNSGLLPI